jgi:hypothetical protein
MQTKPLLERQMMRCGRIPTVAAERLVLDKNEQPIGFKDEHGQLRRFHTMPKLDAQTCAGYASELPEVREVVYAYPQWKERTLTEWLGGESPSPVLLACLAALEGGKNQCESDRIQRQQKEAEDRRRHG